MKKIFLSVFILLLLGFLATRLPFNNTSQLVTGAPPYDPSGGNVSDDADFSWLNDWKRPDGPPKVALQIGHYRNEEVPEELHRLRGNTGATGGGMTEAEVNMAIAEATKTLLEEKGVTVELLPATVPPQYWADVFVAIHADGSEDVTKSGYKAATPRRDPTGTNSPLLSHIERNYEEATGMIKDDNVTRNMRGYYAFSWWRYEHAVHPMTASLILETGFLTSYEDRQIIVGNPDISAQGLAAGIIAYLTEQNLLKS